MMEEIDTNTTKRKKNMSLVVDQCYYMLKVELHVHYGPWFIFGVFRTTWNRSMVSGDAWPVGPPPL